jgi:hypothetical protein
MGKGKERCEYENVNITVDGRREKKGDTRCHAPTGDGDDHDKQGKRREG